ncbi:MAG TPA: hypothetical protein VFT78_04480 [Hanamia sp.]|nr:hypothetical protein [Hanamia sp.]
MKILLSFILFFTFSIVHSQQLKNTEWVKILATRKDGSKINDRIRRDLKVENLYFKDNTVLISQNHQYSVEENYSIENGILSIGHFIKYHIDTAGNLVLKLSEINNQLPDDELNTYGFIKSKYLFEYLKENNQLKIENDSLINCTSQFTPTAKYDLTQTLKRPFQYDGDSVSIKGYFTINQKHKITDIHIEHSANISAKQLTAFNNAIKKTAHLWIIPYTLKPYSFKMKFSCSFKSKYQYIAGHGGEFYTSHIRFNNDGKEDQTSLR